MEFFNDILFFVNKCGLKFLMWFYIKDKYGLIYMYLFLKWLFKISIWF